MTWDEILVRHPDWLDHDASHRYSYVPVEPDGALEDLEFIKDSGYVEFLQSIDGLRLVANKSREFSIRNIKNEEREEEAALTRSVEI